MKKHIKVYFDFFDYGEQDFVACEVCDKRAVDVHHIDIKGMGGSKLKDNIENLIGLCRDCHNKAHRHQITTEALTMRHKYWMENKDKLI